MAPARGSSEPVATSSTVDAEALPFESVGSAGSGEKVEGVGVGAAHDPEVAFVERRDDGLFEALGDSDDGYVGDVEADVGVGVGAEQRCAQVMVPVIEIRSSDQHTGVGKQHGRWSQRSAVSMPNPPSSKSSSASAPP